MEPTQSFEENTEKISSERKIKKCNDIIAKWLISLRQLSQALKSYLG